MLKRKRGRALFLTLAKVFIIYLIALFFIGTLFAPLYYEFVGFVSAQIIPLFLTHNAFLQSFEVIENNTLEYKIIYNNLVVSSWVTRQVTSIFNFVTPLIIFATLLFATRRPTLKKKFPYLLLGWLMIGLFYGIFAAYVCLIQINGPIQIDQDTYMFADFGSLDRFFTTDLFLKYTEFIALMLGQVLPVLFWFVLTLRFMSPGEISRNKFLPKLQV
jgi:hypothetical protein